MNYLSNYSPTLEQFSIDECFLDMSGMTYIYKDLIELAHKIKDEVKEKFGYTVNIGIANNKLCAKMASDFEKPDKVHTLYKDEIETKLWPLDVGDLFMVGKRTKEQLNKLNIYTIRDLAFANDNLLERNFKNQAKHLKEAAWGTDSSKVEPRSLKRDSISTTETLNHDYTDEIKLKEILYRQADDVSRQLRNQGDFANTVAVIFKNNQFVNYSAQAKLSTPSNNTKDIYTLATKIFDQNYKKDPIRLIGIRLSGFTDKKEEQITLFSELQSTEIVEKDEFQRKIDAINNRFGKSIVSPASLKFINNNKPSRKTENKN
jgi:DNA polymerase-4